MPLEAGTPLGPYEILLPFSSQLPGAGTLDRVVDREPWCGTRMVASCREKARSCKTYRDQIHLNKRAPGSQ